MRRGEAGTAFIVAAIVVLGAAGLVALAPDPRVLLPFLVVYYIAMKLSWLDLEPLDILVAGVSSAFTTLVAVYAASGCLGG